MKFSTLLLLDGDEPATLEAMNQVCAVGLSKYNPLGQKNLFVFEKEIIDDRFFWLSCEYDDAASFVDYVINKDTGEREPNPRNKSQIEPRKQFFACYDTHGKFLYISDLSRRTTFSSYLSYSVQRVFTVKNVYSDVNDFCNRIKTIRGFTYTQVDNLFGRGSDIFQQVGNMWGQDLPSKVYIKIGYNDIPIHQGRGIIDKLHQKREEFQNVIIVGCDDEGIEQTFDFSSIIKRIEINPEKDENEHYDPDEVRSLILAELRK